MQQHLQTVGRRLAPGWAAARARRYEAARRQAAGLPALAERVVERIGDRVLEGPCAGLRYPADRLAEVDAPIAKLVGTYERQLHEPLARAVDAGRGPFVDIGCADGYYAVGLARRRADLDVRAFDLAPSARSLCAALAALNGCADRVTIGGRCESRSMRALALDEALVLADIEGAEFELFGAEMVSLLRGALVIVELHRPIDDPACRALRRRFERTHEADVLSEDVPDSDAIAALSFLSPEERSMATSESRGQRDQTWLALTPR